MLAMISDHHNEIVALCHRFRVQRLDIFGSAAREIDFDTERSDVDFLVEFIPDATAPTLDAYFSLREGLSQAVGRSVDLVMVGSVRNPYLSAEIERTKEVVYAA